MASHLPPFEHFATDAVHAGQEPENFKHWPCVPPISLATTFKQPSPGETMGYECKQTSGREHKMLA
jgi:cystathionine gamma-lyase